MKSDHQRLPLLVEVMALSQLLPIWVPVSQFPFPSYFSISILSFIPFFIWWVVVILAVSVAINDLFSIFFHCLNLGILNFHSIILLWSCFRQVIDGFVWMNWKVRYFISPVAFCSEAFRVCSKTKKIDFTLSFLDVVCVIGLNSPNLFSLSIGFISEILI